MLKPLFLYYHFIKFDVLKFLTKNYNMKKIYILAAAVISLSSIAQNFNSALPSLDPYKIISNPHPSKSQNASKLSVASGHLTRGVLAEGLITINSIPNANVALFAQPIYVDSTVITSSTQNPANPVGDHRIAATFDPLSIYYVAGGSQLLSSADPYTVDSLWIGARYVRVNHSIVDTLLVELAWGPANSNTVWTALNIPGPPQLSFIGGRINSSASHGNVSFLTAPAANKKTIKYPLRDADTNRTTNNGYIIIPNVSQLVPAGNKFLASVTFVPGSTVAAGSCVYQYTGGAAQTENGLIGYLISDPSASQTSPDYFYDPTSLSLSHFYISQQRYGIMPTTQSFLNTCHLPTTKAAWDLGFSVTWANSTVGVNELEKTGFALGQNAPNPFTSGSVVSYKLAKNVQSATFSVVDVMGRVISNEKVSTQAGNHNITLGSYAAGVYYYTLNVDGKTSTKKMIVE